MSASRTTSFRPSLQPVDGTGPIATNPRPVRGKDDLLEILEIAY
jgi:hypothetical protein